MTSYYRPTVTISSYRYRFREKFIENCHENVPCTGVFNPLKFVYPTMNQEKIVTSYLYLLGDPIKFHKTLDNSPPHRVSF